MAVAKPFKKLKAAIFRGGLRDFAAKMRKSDRERILKVIEDRGGAAALMANVNEKLKADGTFIETIQELIEWLIEHQEEILALVKAVMLLFGL